MYLDVYYLLIIPHTQNLLILISHSITMLLHLHPLISLYHSPSPHVYLSLYHSLYYLLHLIYSIILTPHTSILLLSYIPHVPHLILSNIYTSSLSPLLPHSMYSSSLILLATDHSSLFPYTKIIIISSLIPTVTYLLISFIFIYTLIYIHYYTHPLN